MDEVVERIEAVTVEDVQALAREHWRPESMSAAVDRPQGRRHP